MIWYKNEALEKHIVRLEALLNSEDNVLDGLQAIFKNLDVTYFIAKTLEMRFAHFNKESELQTYYSDYDYKNDNIMTDMLFENLNIKQFSLLK